MEEKTEQTPEIIIACIAEDTIGYWGADENHGKAFNYLKSPAFPYYVPQALKEDRLNTYKRTMMTGKGDNVTLKEAWTICDQHDLMHMTCEQAVNMVSEKYMTSDSFEKALEIYGNYELANKYVQAHNLTIERTLLQKYPRTFMEKYEATKGLGD
jgi:hypothetical protein